MSQSLSVIWVHAIMGTKDRMGRIDPSVENLIHKLIETELRKKRCRVKEINGTKNHIHLLFTLPRTCSIAEIMKQVKGSVSYKINKHKVFEEIFRWQVGYGAFSVSESELKYVKEYIQEQKKRHRV